MTNKMAPNRIESIQDILCLGFRAFPRHLRKYIIMQWMFIFLIFLIWIKFNGGLWPSLWLFNRKTNDISYDLLDKNKKVFGHLIAQNGDGLSIRIMQEVNSKTLIASAINSDTHVFAGDVMLKGQDTDKQQLIAVMAHSIPAASSEDAVTLNEWVEKFSDSGRILLLRFLSDNSVELGLQTIKEKVKTDTASLILCANIVKGPNHLLAKDKLLNGKRFLHLMNSLMPDHSLCVSWLTNVVLDEIDNMYSWSHIVEMRDMLEHENALRAGTFYVVEAAICKNSIPQLKWLLEVTNGNLLVHASQDEFVKLEHLLHIRQNLPSDRVFYDIHSNLRSNFESHPDASLTYQFRQPRKSDTKQSLTEDLTASWSVEAIDGVKKAFKGSRAIVLQKGFISNKLSSKAEETKEIQAMFSCKVTFVKKEFSNGLANKNSVSLFEGIKVCFSLSETSASNYECAFIGVDGKFYLRAGEEPKPLSSGEFSVDNYSPRRQNETCFLTSFSRTKSKLNFFIMLPELCSDSDSKFIVTKQLEVSMPSDIIPHNFFIHADMNNHYAVLQELNFQHDSILRFVQ